MHLEIQVDGQKNNLQQKEKRSEPMREVVERID